MTKDPLSPGGQQPRNWNSSRRRLLLAGLASAPFLVSLAAQPARATEAMGSLGAYDYGGGTTTTPTDSDVAAPSTEQTSSVQNDSRGDLG